MLKPKLLFLAVLVILTVIPAFTFSHSLWINVTDFNPEFDSEHGPSTKIYFGYGHHYPVDDFIPSTMLSEISLVNSNGEKERITPNEGQFLATELNFKNPGYYIVSTVKKPGFYTMYVDKGKIHHKLGPKTGLQGVIVSLYYEQYAKSIIKVGDAKDENYKRELGHRLEIIPLDNPYNLKIGDTMKFKIVFNGKPARYAKLYATYSGFSSKDDFAYVTTADSNGIAEIRISHHGPHLVKANLRLHAPEDMKDKCNELNYTATLTFSIP